MAQTDDWNQQEDGPDVPLLIVDVDGTVRKGFDELGRFVNGPEDVEVFPEAITMMCRWKAGGGRIIAVSNQGGIALGHVTHELVQAGFDETERQAGVGLIDAVAFCPHHPSATTRADAVCWCRKPSPYMVFSMSRHLEEAMTESYAPDMALMVGDMPEDEECARRAGIDFQWAKDWRAQA